MKEKDKTSVRGEQTSSEPATLNHQSKAAGGIGLREFYDALYPASIRREGESFCLTREIESGKGYKTVPVDDRRVTNFKSGEHAWYFCVSTVRRPEPRPNGRYGKWRRKREDLVRGLVLCLDDIGTSDRSKVDPNVLPDVVPSYIIETSENNFQYGYLLDPIDMTDELELEHYEACVLGLVDAGLSDPGATGAYRVMRIPGSIHKSGFISRVVHWEPSTRYKIANIMSLLGVEPRRGSKSRRHVAPLAIEQRDEGDLREMGGVDVVLDWLRQNNYLTGNRSGDFLEVICPWHHEHTSGGDVAGYVPLEFSGSREHRRAFHCFHAHCKDRGRDEFLDWAVSLGCPDPRVLSVAEHQEHNGESLFSLLSELADSPSESNAAVVFCTRFRDHFIFMHGLGSWFYWDGTRYLRDSMKAALHEMRKLCVDAELTPSYQRASFYSNALKLAAADPSLARWFEQFDSDNYLLATPAGVVDLRTGVLRSACPDDNVTLRTRVAPTSGGGERFQRFLSEIFPDPGGADGGDTETLEYIQRALGACLSGAKEEHWLQFWIGAGRNGKNTLGDLILYVLGDYAKAVPSELLMARKHQEHPTEIANLRGIRLAVSSELDEGASWNESRLNQLTGDTVLSARFMRQDPIQFERTHKHLIYANHKPALRNVTPAIKSRVRIVPFTQSFIGREDPDLGAKLREEAGSVLQWLIDGHVAWLANGKQIGDCPSVRAETNAYFEVSDTMSQWIAECCEIHLDRRDAPANHWAKAGDLFKSYQRFMHSISELPLTNRTWGERMTQRFEKRQSEGARYLGVLLKNRDFDKTDEEAAAASLDAINKVSRGPYSE